MESDDTHRGAVCSSDKVDVWVEGEREVPTSQREQWLRCVLISDTHNQHQDLCLPSGRVDMFIHMGDFTQAGRPKAVTAFAQWFKALPAPHKVVIAGNHELKWSKHSQDANRAKMTAKDKSFTYLQHSSAVIEGIRFFGSPYTPKFHGAFNVERGPKLAALWEDIPQETDVLLTHGPPTGVLDKTSRGASVGCVDLLDRVQRVQPSLHVFGHIHEAHGWQIGAPVPGKRNQVLCENTLFVNAANKKGGMFSLSSGMHEPVVVWIRKRNATTAEGGPPLEVQAEDGE